MWGMMEEQRRREALRRIAIRAEGGRRASHRGSPFESLIGTILSQNTNDRNSRLALQNLGRRIGTDAKSLSEASVEEIKECIRPAGLYNLKAPRIRSVAKHVRENFPQGIESLFEHSDEEIRRTLTSITGIGEKTADIVLAFSASRDVLPVDTHVKRIASRLKFTDKGAGYEEIRSALEEATPRGRRPDMHLALIWFGRNVCVARKPRCNACPVAELCPSRGWY